MEIIAKQEYTDKYVSLYEGQIRNITDPLAEKLIEQNIVAEHSDSSDQASGGNGCFSFDIRSSVVDGQTVYTASATFADILAAINEGKDVVCWEIPWGNLRQTSYKDIYVNEDADSGEVTFIEFCNTTFTNNELSTATYTIQSYNNLVEFNIESKDLS